MELRTSLSAQPHLYMGDSTGRPLDYGMVYFGQPNKDPEFYPIDIYYDEALTIAASQPVRTKGGFLNANGDMVEVYAAELTYSVKVLDSYGRKVLYQKAMSRTNTSGSISTKLPYANTITRTLAERNTDAVSVKDFGAIGDGIANDSVALNAAFNSGLSIFLPEGDYLYDFINIDAPLSLSGIGRLKYSGQAGGGEYTINVNAALNADVLHITTNGSADAVYGIARFNADDVDINQIKVISGVQRNQTGGCVFLGNNIRVGAAEFKNIARPLAFTNENGVDADLYKWRKNVHVGSVVIDTYIRGVKFRCIENLSLGNSHIQGLWVGRTTQPGYNGVLLETVKDGQFGDCYIANSLEHGLRIGGNEGSQNLSFSNIYTKDTLGCGFKNAPTPPFRSSNITIGSITAYDAGLGAETANNEGVRLSSMDNTTIGSITVLKRVKDALLLSDVSKLRIGKLYAEGISSRALSFNQDRDMTVGICDDISIDEIIAFCNPTARYAIGAFYNATGRYINNLRIGNAYLTGYNFAAVGLTDTDIRNSEINITTSASDISTGFDGEISNTVLTQYKRLGGYYFGMAKNAYTKGAVTADSPQFQPENNDNKAGVYISSLSTTVGTDKYGAWLGFSRLGSSRRGAVIAIKQTGPTSNQNGLAFLTQDTSTAANESVGTTLLLKHNGVINAPRLPTSATGLVAGDIWRDGNVLKIV